MSRTTVVALCLALFAAATVSGCTSYSEETWIDPSIGRLPEEAAEPPDDAASEGD